MTKILVVAGTADSIAFLEKIPDSIGVIATTFSKLGADCIPPRKELTVYSGALDLNGFRSLLQKESVDFLVDMSHPFAVEVSKNAKEAAEKEHIPYLRYQRESIEDAQGVCRRFPDFSAAAEALKTVHGNIFLTIGSKNLHYFKVLPDFENRCYMRVLAESRILSELEEMGVDPGHIFAMKGVASKELNIALARQCNAKVIVSKDSGIAGGIVEKTAAAAELGIPLFLIDKPKDDGNTYHTFEEIITIIERK